MDDQLAWYLGIWVGIITLFIAFVAREIRSAFDHDPDTNTLSEYVMRWKDLSRRNATLVWGFVIWLFAGPIYMLLHWGLELV